MTNDQAALITSVLFWQPEGGYGSDDVLETATYFANWLDERERERQWKRPTPVTFPDYIDHSDFSDRKNWRAPLCRKPSWFGSHAEVLHDEVWLRESCTCPCHDKGAQQ